MNFSLLLNGTQLTIYFREHGDYRFFNEVCDEIVRREKTVVINEIVIEIDGINYLIPKGIEKIHNGSTEDEILLDKMILDPHQLEKEKEILKEKARVAFESSDAVKKIKEKEARALIKKQAQEQERIDNEEPVWFYSNDVKTREGPISFNELKKLHKNKTIADDTLVWSPRLEEWEEAYKIVNKKETTKATHSSPKKEHDSNVPEIVDHQPSSNVGITGNQARDEQTTHAESASNDTTNWYFEVLKKYAVFNGRARRKEYWYFVLFNTIISIVLVFIDSATGNFSPEVGMGLFGVIYMLAVLIPGIAVLVRRLHDTNHSGWWFLIILIPLIGAIVLFVFLVSDSKPEDNQYGESPKLAAA